MTWPAGRFSRGSAISAALRKGIDGGFLFFFFAVIPALYAQSTVGEVTQSDGRSVPTAVGILTPHLENGRFGTSLSGGYLAPSQGGTSRFDSGVVLTPSGEFVGVDNNLASSRFGGYWEQRADGELVENQPLSERDLLLYLRAQRNREATQNQMAQNPMPENPQQVSAIPESPLPYRQPGAGEPAADETELAQNVPTSIPQGGPERRPNLQNLSSEQIWMRGSAGYRDPTPSPLAGMDRGFDSGEDAQPGLNSNVDRQIAPIPPGLTGISGSSGRPEIDGGGRIVGGSLSNLSQEEAVSLPSSALARNGRAENRRQTESIQEYLESLILKSPVVSPLSPIQVTLRGSTATILGIVPTEAGRVEAGRVLLTDPRVESVDNRLTVLSADPDAPLPKPFDPSLPQKED